MNQDQARYLVDSLQGTILIGGKWIFKNKISVNRHINTFKARLVGKGYGQREGVKYDKTFSPITMIKSIRILLTIATHCEYKVWHMDVKTVFLNGNL